jgi:hypothetical protein
MDAAKQRRFRVRNPSIHEIQFKESIVEIQFKESAKRFSLRNPE